jgi:hypothetical protein
MLFNTPTTNEELFDCKGTSTGVLIDGKMRLTRCLLRYQGKVIVGKITSVSFKASCNFGLYLLVLLLRKQGPQLFYSVVDVEPSPSLD